MNLLYYCTHNVIEQIFDNRLSFLFSIFCDYSSRVQSVKIYYSHNYGKCMNLWFCLFKLGFCIGEERCFNSERPIFFTGCWSVTGLLKECYRMCLCQMLTWRCIWSLCLYALISLLCMCSRVCLWVRDWVKTSQLNLLKICVHPALPPALPQASHVSTAVP